jgi:hypothetical protein
VVQDASADIYKAAQEAQAADGAEPGGDAAPAGDDEPAKKDEGPIIDAEVVEEKAN